MEKEIALFKEALLAVDKAQCTSVLQELGKSAHNLLPIAEIISESLQDIGDEWEAGDVSLAQVYMSGVICEELFEKYVPESRTDLSGKQKVAMVVLADRHALGKRIVEATLRAHGYEIIDFGCGLDVEEVVALVKQHDIKLLLVSTLMLHAALKVEALKEKLVASGCETRIIVGGAPFRFDPDLWKRVKADGFCFNAMEAVEFLKREEDSNG